MNKPRLKPLPTKEQKLKLPRTTSLSYFLIRKFPGYFKARKQVVKLIPYAKVITPIAIIIITTVIMLLLIMESISKSMPPPNEVMGLQLNIILMSTLLVFNLFWGLGCKYMRVQIPRGAAGF